MGFDNSKHSSGVTDHNGGPGFRTDPVAVSAGSGGPDSRCTLGRCARRLHPAAQRRGDRQGRRGLPLPCGHIADPDEGVIFIEVGPTAAMRHFSEDSKRVVG